MGAIKQIASPKASRSGVADGDPSFEGVVNTVLFQSFPAHQRLRS